jgi:hypothetical protein
MIVENEDVLRNEGGTKTQFFALNCDAIHVLI